MKSYWINFPVADIRRTKAFYESLGLKFHQGNTDDNMAGLKVGNQTIMFFKKEVLESRIGEPFADPAAQHAVIVSFDLDTNQQADELAEQIEQSGGQVLDQPDYSNGYYGFMFKDPDGHLFNVIII